MNKTLLAIACGMAFTTFALAESGNIYLMDEIVVTAKRFQSPLAPGMTVITGDEIAARPTATLPELLATQAGIQVRSADGSPDMSIDLRGFGASGNQNSLVLLNGQRLNEIELTSIAWSSIPLDAIDRIEILRGSGAVLWGGGATGGVINIITRQPGTMGFNKLRLSAGSYDTLNGEFSLDHKGEGYGFNLAGSGLTSNNYRDHNAIERKNVEAALRFPREASGLTLRFGGVDQELELPGPRSQAQLASDRRGVDSLYSSDYNTLTGSRAGLTWEGRVGTAETNVDLNWRRNQRRALFWGFSEVNTESDVIALSPRIRMSHGWLGRENSLVLGLDWDNWDYASTRNTPAILSAGQKNQAAYFNNDTTFASGGTLTLGARLHGTHYEARDILNPETYASGKASHTLHAWEIAYRHPTSARSTVYGRVGQSFRVPTVDEMFDQYGGPVYDSIVNPLEPQTSQDTSLGMAWVGGGHRVHVAAYHMDLKNEIHFNAITFTNMNLSPTRRYGIEVESAFTLLPTVSVTANYTLAIAKFREGVYYDTDVSGNKVPLVPRHSLALGANWQMAAGHQLSASARHVGTQRFDNDQANTFAGGKMPAYTVVDLKYSHDAGPWRITASVHNMFDEKYFTYAVASTAPYSTNFNAYPAAERNFSLSAEYRF